MFHGDGDAVFALHTHNETTEIAKYECNAIERSTTEHSGTTLLLTCPLGEIETNRENKEQYRKKLKPAHHADSRRKGHCSLAIMCCSLFVINKIAFV